jgi:hypothetical protein
MWRLRVIFPSARATDCHECEEGLGMLHRKHEAPGGHADKAVTHATKNFGGIPGVPRSSIIALIIPAMTWAL